MDIDGNYTDRHGKPIGVGTTIRVAAHYDYAGPQEGVGEVIALPKAGNDWHGFPRVRMHDDGRVYHIPDNELIRVGDQPDSQIGLLEAAVRASRDANDALLRLVETAGAGQPGVDEPPTAPTVTPAVAKDNTARVVLHAPASGETASLHVEMDGATVDLTVGLTDHQDRPVSRVDVALEDGTRGGDRHGNVWQRDGARLICVGKYDPTVAAEAQPAWQPWESYVLGNGEPLSTLLAAENRATVLENAPVAMIQFGAQAQVDLLLRLSNAGLLLRPAGS